MIITSYLWVEEWKPKKKPSGFWEHGEYVFYNDLRSWDRVFLTVMSISHSKEWVTTFNRLSVLNPVAWAIKSNFSWLTKKAILWSRGIKWPAHNFRKLVAANPEFDLFFFFFFFNPSPFLRHLSAKPICLLIFSLFLACVIISCRG